MTPELVQQIISDRKSGAPRLDICAKYNITLGSLKHILKTNGVVIDPKTRQSNAYQSKLAKNPDAMAQMRTTLTGEVLVRRAQSIKEAYEDPELRAKKGQQSRDWWRSDGPDSKYDWTDLRAAAASRNLKCLSSENGPLPSRTAEFQCFCGQVWTTTTFDVLYGKVGSCGCVKSRPQAEINELIQSWGYATDSNNRSVLAPLELDIVIESKKLAIEYCGLTWHSELKGKPKSYHLNKLTQANAAGYRLVTIFADEWLHRREAVVGYLTSLLGQPTRIGARETKISQVGWEHAKWFMDAHHIQGSGAPQAVVYGLYSRQSELLALATFKPTNTKRKGQATDGVWELVRYCVKSGIAVAGGFRKLLAHFKAQHNPKLLFTFSDRRWSEGQLYKSAGFSQARLIGPSYWYFKKNTDGPRHHKSKFRKSKIEAGDQTEWDKMVSLGYDRIWDCGLIGWETSIDLDTESKQE